MKEVFKGIDINLLKKHKGRIGCPFSKQYNRRRISFSRVSEQPIEYHCTNTYCGNLFPNLYLRSNNCVRCPCSKGNSIYIQRRFWEKVREYES